MKWSPIDYAASAVIAQKAGEEMFARLDWMTLQPKTIVDMGCGTGEHSARLRQYYPDANVIAMDIDESMLQQATSLACLCANAANLPFKDQSIDLIFANFLLPWCEDITAVLQEWRRVLRPEGLLMLTALGPDTLREWRGEQIIPHRIDMHEVGDRLTKEGFADPVLDVDYYTTTYREVNRLQQELTASGMIHSTVELMSAPALSVTYEVVYAHAFGPMVEPGFGASAGGEVRIPLSHLRQRRL